MCPERPCLCASKSNRSLNLPGSILSCMCTLSGVVHFEACLKIGGHTDIVSTRVCNTMEYINIIEFQNHGLPRRSSPQSYIAEKPGLAIKTATPWHASSAYSGERRMEAGGFEPPSNRFCKSLILNELRFNHLWLRQLNHSHECSIFSLFIRIWL